MTTGARTLRRFGSQPTTSAAPIAAALFGLMAPEYGWLAAAASFLILVFGPRFGTFPHRARTAISRMSLTVIVLSLLSPPLDQWVRAGAISLGIGLACAGLIELIQHRRGDVMTAGEATLLVGEPEAVRDAAMLFAAYGSHNVRPVATATPDGLLPTVLPGGSIEDIHSLIPRYGIEHIMTVSASVSKKLEMAIGRGRPIGVRLSAVQPLGEILTGKVDVVSVRGLPFVTLAPRRPTNGPSWALKRTVDYVAAAAGLLLLSPVLVLAAIAVKLDSKGPVFFRQERVGRNGHLFRLWKFRSMVEDAEHQLVALLHRNEAEGVYFKIEQDPRVTRVGRWLRRLSIDELPQLINVLTGEMSLVGPRPFLATELAADPEAFEWRLPFLPGMTGLWQIAGRSWLPRLEGLRMDLAYIEHWSPALDLRILFRTMIVAFRNDRRPPVNTGELTTAGLDRSKYLGLVEHDELHRSEAEFDVSVVIVTHESVNDIAACIDSVRSVTDGAADEIIVVDNASSDGTADLVASLGFDDVRLIRKRRRDGFSVNSNIGAAASSGRHLLFLQPDTRVSDGAIDTLVEYLDAHPEVGAVGPRLVYPDGTLQWSARRFPRLLASVARRTPLRLVVRNITAMRHHMTADVGLTAPMDVDWLLGTALAVRSRACTELGGFDDGFRLYCEDIDFCWRLQNVGWRVQYLPTAVIEHDLEHSSRQIFSARPLWHFRSVLRFIRIHGFRRPSVDGTPRRLVGVASAARARIVSQSAP